jgi:hypothetical protein
LAVEFVGTIAQLCQESVPVRIDAAEPLNRQHIGSLGKRVLVVMDQCRRRGLPAVSRLLWAGCRRKINRHRSSSVCAQPRTRWTPLSTSEVHWPAGLPMLDAPTRPPNRSSLAAAFMSDQHQDA